MFCEGSQSSRSENSSVTGQLDLHVVSGGWFILAKMLLRYQLSDITAVTAGEQLEEPHRGPAQQFQAESKIIRFVWLQMRETG